MGERSSVTTGYGDVKRPTAYTLFHNQPKSHPPTSLKPSLKGPSGLWGMYPWSLILAPRW